MKNKTGIYTFCSIKTEDPTTFQSVKFDLKETKVYTLHYKDIAMVVAKVPLKIYTPKRENLLAHQSVISNVMKDHSVIPISFGNVFKSEEDVLVLLKKLYQEFTQIFPKIENKFEVGLKIIGNKEWLKEEVEQNSQIKKLKETMQRKSKNAAYYDRIRLGELTKNFFLSLQEQIVEEVYLPLSELAESSKENDIINERMLLNAAFLIDSTVENEFDKKVNEIYQKWAEKVEFKYTGPWPPYNFINIKLKVEG
ncbi:GvpL/GvpF family gas vesicle protein [Alkalihalobacterium chitinilyticum]|uniref:GvpL/GvpF family gas vesicle protein n=1 Tax=Alkalihalobacterium chitinilyticum TaxID=2980103 RepID=A0ABT5VDX8_9BACI|nr:GvpL/GvpF family gas vesicle protein [Alkalihalobacterium chitinilyticum]MDE5413662.1 GvpL/GvpF family gas vesicle protein [Alkalihalobacterium chitinilyticum]